MPRFTIDIAQGLDSSDILDCLLENGFAICERSEILCREDDMVRVYTSANQREWEQWAEETAESDSYVCESCGERFADDCGSYLDAASGWVCDECAGENYSACDECGDTFANEDLDEDCRCCDCRRQTGLASYHGDKIRNSWNHIPTDAIGVELEFFAPNSDTRDESASEFRNLLCAVERDGSLCGSRGMEIITPPQSPNMVRETLRRVCEIARNHHIIGQPRGDKNYGIHVNVNAASMFDSEIARFCDIFSSVNQGWLEIIAGRKESDWAKYKREIDGVIPHGKYAAAGQKGTRIEVRVFRSTNFIDSVLGFVSLCDDLRRYVKSAPYSPDADAVLAWLGQFGSAETVAMLERKLQGRNARTEWVGYLRDGMARRESAIDSVV